jgi:hypothetical protein
VCIANPLVAAWMFVSILLKNPPFFVDAFEAKSLIVFKSLIGAPCLFGIEWLVF